MRRVYWTGYCYKPRNQAIYEINQIVNQYGALLDFKMFSDVSMSLVIEIEARNLAVLKHALQEWVQIDEDAPFESNGKQTCFILAHLTFTKGTGNLKIEVPAVPG